MRIKSLLAKSSSVTAVCLNFYFLLLETHGATVSASPYLGPFFGGKCQSFCSYDS